MYFDLNDGAIVVLNPSPARVLVVITAISVGNLDLAEEMLDMWVSPFELDELSWWKRVLRRLRNEYLVIKVWRPYDPDIDHGTHIRVREWLEQHGHSL